MAKAEEIYLQSAERYPASAYSLSHLAQFYWRQGEFAQAAGVVKKGRSSGAMRYDWYFEAFSEVFLELPPEKGLEAYKAFADARRPAWEVERLAEKLADNGLHQLAYEIAGLQMPVNPHAVATRCILLNTIGRTLQNPPDTVEALRNLIKADYRKDRLQNMLLSKGKYALAYDIYKDAAAFDNNVRHAIMLNNLVCWLRLDKQPPAAEQEFMAFFNQKRDSYLMLPGRFLLGLTSREAFLASADTVSKRALVCYYIGLQERLRGKFDEAAIWYQMCRETMGRVYQTGWAIAELRHWFDAGTSNLAKLDKADVLQASAEL